MNDLQVCMWPIDRPIPYARNSRKIPERAIDKVAASIQEFGWRVPIVVDKDGVVICGHTRLLAAKKLGLREVPVHVADNLTPAQVKAYRLMDNRSHQDTDWDVDLLGPELEDLAGLDFDLSLTGFDQHEIDKFLADPDDEDRANAAPPAPDDPVTKPGDLWLCGKHRVLCGDSTSADSVARLLGDRKPRLMVTDPPYGVSLDSEWRDRSGINKHGPAEPSYMKRRIAGHTETTISGDTRADWSEAFALVPSLEILYAWHATSHMVEVAQGIERIGFELRQQLIWFKTNAAISRSAYHWQHEPCLYAVRKGKTANWQGTRDQTTVWSAASPKMIMGGSKEQKLNHPTQKPVELMRRPILNHTKRGELVFEPFLGSGTTLAAAEITERVCLGIELDAKYVDVVVLRWQGLTGKQAKLDGEGRTFDEIAVERRGVPV
jgi:DNA modification methylase